MNAPKFHAGQIPGTDWFASMQTITPQMAAAFLSNNGGNRKIRKGAVAKYAAIIGDGNWRRTPEAVIFDKDGVLMNGQHRMSAIVKSGVSVDMLVITNVERDAFPALDRGVSRTTADATGLPKKLVETARWCELVRGTHQSQMTDDLIARTAEVLDENHTALMDFCGTATRTFSSSPVRLAACLRMNQGADQCDHAMLVYRAMAHSHMQDLPPVAVAFVNRVYAASPNHAWQARLDLTWRAWIALGIRNAQNTRIQIKSTRGLRAEMVAEFERMASAG